MRRCFFLLLLYPAAAFAHQISVSFSELTVEGRDVGGVLRFALADLRTQMEIDPRRLPVQALTWLVLESFVVKASGRACALQPDATASLEGEDGLALQARWLCDAPVEELSVRAGFLDSFPIGHAHLSRVSFGPGEVSQRVAQVQEPSFEARRSRPAAQEFRRFLLLGIEHIFSGYDHIAFLIGLLLLGGSVRELVKIVTAFTLAHSVTLALAALNVFAPSPRIVEPLIAASIVFIGVENLWALSQRRAGWPSGWRTDSASLPSCASCSSRAPSWRRACCHSTWGLNVASSPSCSPRCRSCAACASGGRSRRRLPPASRCSARCGLSSASR